jgi:hypothetical protein
MEFDDLGCINSSKQASAWKIWLKEEPFAGNLNDSAGC